MHNFSSMGKGISGEGSIKQRKSGKLAGKWRAQWAYNDPVTGEYVAVDKTFASQTQAKDFLADLKAKVRTGQKIAEAGKKKALTLNAWFDELAGTKENKYQGRWSEDGGLPLTVSTRVSRYNSHVRKSFLGELPIKNIFADDVRDFYRELRNTGRSAATIKDVKSVLVKVVNDATETYEKLPNLRNVFSKVKVETPPHREAVALSVEQARKAIAAQRTAKERAMLGLFLLAGLRLSEQMALCKEQIDFAKGVILIDRAVKLGPTGQQEVGLPKGKKARVVAMCPSLAELLCPLMDGGKRHLFPAATLDQPRMKNLVYATWRKSKKNGNLPKEMVIKDCRLSHNNWIEKLMPMVSTSTRLEHMGHSTTGSDPQNKGIGVNLANYTRLLNQAQEILRNELEKTLGLSGLDLAPFEETQED